MTDSSRNSSTSSYSSSSSSHASTAASVQSSSSSSRTSSIASHPSSQRSPSSHVTLPLLSRRVSAASQASPMTPTYAFEPLDPTKAASDPHFSFLDPHQAAAQAAAQQQHQRQAALQMQQTLAVAGASFYAPAQSGLGGAGPQQYFGIPAASTMRSDAASSSPFLLDDAYLQQSMNISASPAVQLQYPTNLIEQTPIISAVASPNPNASGPAQSLSPTTTLASVTSDATATSPTLAAAARPVKKKYPCPHAARFSCTDTFTTSGHAARHGKKHTGEKNILCPTCHKAFTRKDNMKQHERTHKIHRGGEDGAATTTSKDGAADDAARSRRRRAKSVSSNAPPSFSTATSGSNSNSTGTELDVDGGDEGADEGDRDGVRRLGRPSIRRPDYFGTVEAKTARPLFDRHFSGESLDGEGESPGLDALAMAAQLR